MACWLCSLSSAVDKSLEGLYFQFVKYNKDYSIGALCSGALKRKNLELSMHGQIPFITKY